MLTVAVRSVGSALSTPGTSMTPTSTPAAFLDVAGLTPNEELVAMNPGSRMRAMHTFWTGLGLTDPVSKELARRARRNDNAWSNPLVLLQRLNGLQAALPTVHLAHILDATPGLLMYKPSRLREKLMELAQLLPGVDVLKLVSIAPDVLQRDMAKVAERIASLRTIPRSDVSQIIAENPQLLRENHLSLRARIDVLPLAFSPVLLQRIPRDRLAVLLRWHFMRLQRLVYISKVYPGVRGWMADMKIIRMSQAHFQQFFKPRRLTARRMSAAKNTHTFGPVRPIREVPRGTNPFRLGEARLVEWRVEVQEERQQIIERRGMPATPLFPRRNQGNRLPQRHPDFARMEPQTALLRGAEED